MCVNHRAHTTRFLKVVCDGASEVAWQVKVLTAKPEELSSVLGTHMVEEEN